MALSLTDIFLAQRNNTTYHCTLEDILNEYNAGNAIVCGDRPEGPHCEGTLWYSPTTDELYVYLCAGTNCGKGHGGCFEPDPIIVDGEIIDPDGGICDFVLVTNDGTLTIATHGENASAANTFSANEANNVTITLPQIRYQDLSGQPTIGDGDLTIQTHGENASAANTFGANETADVTITLPQIRYQDLSGQPTIGDATLTIQTHGGNSATNTFTANATSDVTITLPQISYSDLSNLPTIGDGALVIQAYNNAAASSTGSYTANQVGGSTITLPQIRYGDLSGQPTIGDGTITISQPGIETDQTFTVNQTGNTTITLLNTDTWDVANFTFTDNNITSTQDVVLNATGSGYIGFKSKDTNSRYYYYHRSNGKYGAFDFSSLSSSDRVYTYPDKDGTVAMTNDIGNATITLQSYGSNTAANSTFTTNQGTNETITLPQISYTDLSSRPTIGDGTITVVQPGTTNQTFTVNQTGNTTITLKNDNTQVNLANFTFTNNNITSTDAFILNAGGTNSISFKTKSSSSAYYFYHSSNGKYGQFAFSGLSDNRTYTWPNKTGTVAMTNDIGNATITLQSYGENVSANSTFTTNQGSNETITLPQIRYSDIKSLPTIGNGTITITQPGASNQTFTVNQTGNTTIALRNDNTQVNLANFTFSENNITSTAGFIINAGGTSGVSFKSKNTSSYYFYHSTNGKYGQFNFNGLNADRTYTWQNASGTVALTSNIGNAIITLQSYGENAKANSTFTTNQSGNETITLPQIRYSDIKSTPTIGNATITLQSYGEGVSANSTFTTNQTTNETITLPQIRYTDLKSKPTIPSVGNGTITIVQPGTTNQTFTVNQSGNTTINLKNDNTVPSVGNGVITLRSYGENVNASSTFSMNQGGNETITLPQIRYSDIKSRPTIPSVGNGTITIKQPGTTDQAFTVNQSGNTTINLKNDNTVPSVGNGTITIKQPGVSDQTFTVNQTGNKTITLKNDNTIPSVGNGAINVNAGNGISASGSNATANQSGATTRTLSAKAGDNTITVDSAGIKVNKGNLGIPSVGNGTITVVQPGTSNQTFSVNQSGNTTITLKNDNTVPSVGNGVITLRSYGENVNASSTFSMNQGGNETITLPQIRYSDIKGAPTSLTGNYIKKDADDNVTGNTEWQDNYQVRLGTGADFRMHFNGNDTVFRNYAHSNGDIIFQGENSSGTNHNLLIMKTDSSNTYSIIYANNSERLRTTTSGIKVTSTIEANYVVPSLSGLGGIGTTDKKWGDVKTVDLLVDDVAYVNNYVQVTGDSSKKILFGTYGSSSTVNHTIGAGINLHIDSITSGGIYLQHYSGRDTNIGMGSTKGSLYVGKTIYCQGNIVAFWSDDRLKTDKIPITSALSKVLSLNGFTYVPNEKAKELGYDDERRHAGVSAQDVQKVLPEAVFPAPIDSNYLTVQYEKLVPLLIESIKELNEEVKNLKDQVNQLRG